MEPMFPLETNSHIKVRNTKRRSFIVNIVPFLFGRIGARAVTDVTFGEFMKVRFLARVITVRLRDLEIALQSMERISEHKVELESYPTPANIAAAILFAAQMEHKDIENKTVCDLGCGDGVFAYGAALLGAECVLGIDLHSKALKAARRNSSLLGTTKVNFVLGDVNSLALRIPVDTVVSNPPFGTKKRGADLEFLRTATSIAHVIYSMHLAGDSNRRFLSDAIRKMGGSVTQIETFQFPIRPIYKFHRKAKHLVNVDLYRIVMNECD